MLDVCLLGGGGVRRLPERYLWGARTRCDRGGPDNECGEGEKGVG